VPVIGVPVKASISLDGWDSLLSIVQMPPGIPVATVGLNAARNAGILAVQILATADNEILEKVKKFKANLGEKVLKAKEEIQGIKYDYKVD
jgi:5-(carboxyamino)imidazole ribonucleotide mutase